MTYVDLAWLAQNGLFAWLGVLAALLAWRFLTRPEMTVGLLSTTPGRRIEPDRLQALAVTALVVVGYLAHAVARLRAGDTAQVPAVPEELLSILTGSQAVYLTGKVARTFN